MAIRPQSAPAAQAAGAASALTVERIYSYPSLSGRILRDTVWSPDGKLLTYLERRDRSGRPANLGRGRGDRPAPRAGGQPSTCATFCCRQPRAARQTGLGRLTPPQYLWSPDGKALLFISAQELFWYDLASANLATTGHGRRNQRSGGDEIRRSGHHDRRRQDFARRPLGQLPARSRHLGRERSRRRSRARSHAAAREERRNGELDWVYPEELDLAHRLLVVARFRENRVSAARRERTSKNIRSWMSCPYKAKLTEERYPVAGSPNPVARVGVVRAADGRRSSLDGHRRGFERAAGARRLAAGFPPRGHRAPEPRAESPRSALRRCRQRKIADRAHRRGQILDQSSATISISSPTASASCGPASAPASAIFICTIWQASNSRSSRTATGKWRASPAWTNKNGQVYFTSTQQSPIERQFYRVALSGGAARAADPRSRHAQRESRAGLHAFPRHLFNGHDAAAPDLYNADGSAVAALDENKVPELASYRLQPVEFFTVPGADGTPLDAALIKPPDFDPTRKYPVIVYLYGGPQAQEVRDAWQGADFLWHEMMAAEGIRDFRAWIIAARPGAATVFETPIYHHFGQAELADQLAGVAWLKQQPYVDRARIGIWGWSYGGYMTCVAMLRAGGVFKAGFAGAPVTDWRQYDTIYTERYMGTPQENPDGYRDSSPVNFAAGLQGKLLIAHATGDDNVHFANTVELAEKFVDAQKYAEYQIYAGRGHGISDAAARIHIFNRVTQFFVENLAMTVNGGHRCRSSRQLRREPEESRRRLRTRANRRFFEAPGTRMPQ